MLGNRVSDGILSRFNQNVYKRIAACRNEPITGKHTHVYFDGLVVKHTRAGEVRHFSVMGPSASTRIGIGQYWPIARPPKALKAGWSAILKHLKERGNSCRGLVESLGEHVTAARWERCTVYYYRNVLSLVPRGRRRELAAMLKAIHVAKDRDAALETVQRVIAKLKDMKLAKAKAAELVEASIEQSLAYHNFRETHWRRIRTNNPLERIMRQMRSRTKVVGAFPYGQSVLMLCAVRLRHIAGTAWGTRRYRNMEALK